MRYDYKPFAYVPPPGHVIACDGAKSPVRAMLGLEFEGELFEERFLIADIEMQADFPPERRFWFEPRFHPGQSALLHKQPDNIYRIDLQLGPDAAAPALIAAAKATMEGAAHPAVDLKVPLIVEAGQGPNWAAAH